MVMLFCMYVPVKYFIKSTSVSVLSYELGPLTPFPVQNGSPLCLYGYFAYTRLRERSRGGWPQIIRQQRSLVIYKLYSFYLCRP